MRTRVGLKRTYRLRACDRFRPLMHNLYGIRQLRLLFSHREIMHFSNNLRQIVRFLLRLSAVSDHSDFLSAEELRIAGRAVADTASQQLVFSRERFSHDDSCRQNDGGRLKNLAGRLDSKIISHRIHHIHALLRHLDAKTCQLFFVPGSQVRSGDLRQSRIV